MLPQHLDAARSKAFAKRPALHNVHALIDHAKHRRIALKYAILIRLALKLKRHGFLLHWLWQHLFFAVLVLKRLFFPRLARAEGVADEIEFRAITAPAAIRIEYVKRDIFHHALCRWRIVEVFAISAQAAPRLGFVDLPYRRHVAPIVGICSRINAGLFRPKIPIADHAIAIDDVLFSRHNAFGFDHG